MLNEYDIFKDYIKQFNLRWTPQRKLVLNVFLQQSGHVHIDDIYVGVREEDPTIGIATIYRTMKLLVESGLEEVHTFNNKNYLRTPFSGSASRPFDM